MLDGITNRVDTAGNKIRQLENIALETIQREAQRGKRLGEKNEQISVIHGAMSGWLAYVLSESQKGEERKKFF